jgi:phosphoribosylanthranilate isomerase
MTVEAKICGLSTPETVDAAIEFGARWVGFATYPRSPRHVASNDVLKALSNRVPAGIGRVGFFVDPDDSLLAARLAAGAFDMIQLHGAETPGRVVEIRALTGKPVMKVIKVAEATDVERGIAAFAGVADRLMFDAAEGTLPGGKCACFRLDPLVRPRGADTLASGGRLDARQRRRGCAGHERAHCRRFFRRRIEPGCQIDRVDPRLSRAGEGAVTGSRA